MTQQIGATCKTDFRAAHDSGPRYVKNIKIVVLHSTEGDTARAAAEWFANPQSAGSAHIVVDDKECYRTVPNDVTPWAAPGANTIGFHIEQAGYAHWTREEWLKHDKTLRRSAYKAAYHCKLFGIPIVRIGAPELKAGKKGITSHAECTKAFGGDHTDPGPNYPWDIFLKYAKEYAASL